MKIAERLGSRDISRETSCVGMFELLCHVLV